MAKAETTTSTEAAATPQGVNLQLLPADGNDRPAFANVTIVQPTAGVALIDFGFLDPGAFESLRQMARSGKKVPERINGRLTARVALSYDVLVNLQRQIAGALQAVSKAAEAQAQAQRKEKGGG